jgi:hypothetical protein
VRSLPTAVATLLFVLAACGSSGSSKVDGKPGGSDGSNKPKDAAIDATYDFGCGGNTACPIQDVCCTNPASPPTFSCVAPASCMAGNSISCDGPDECGGATPICCGVEVPNGGTFPQCKLKSLGTTCSSAASCPTQIATNCNNTTKVTICHVKADCTDSTYNQCCTFNSGGGMLTFCTTQQLANLAGAQCHQ